MAPAPSKQELLKKLSDTETDLANATKKIEELRKRLISKSNENSGLNIKLTKLKDEWNDLNKDFKNLKQAYETLKEETPVITQYELDKLNEELRKAKDELLKNQLSVTLPDNVHALQRALNDSRNDLVEQIECGDDLEEQNEQLRKQLEAQEMAGRSGKRNMKEQLRKQLEAWEMAGRAGKRNMKERIEAIGKDDLYPVKIAINNHVTRVIIFLENDSDLAEALQICYKKCPDTIKEKYEETEFMALFGDLLCKTLSDWKNQVQGKAKDAAQCKCLYFANGSFFVYLRDANFTICPIAQLF